MPSVQVLVSAIPMDDSTVHVRFEDGLSPDVDLSYLVEYGPVFEPLCDRLLPTGSCRPRDRHDRLAERGRHRTRDALRARTTRRRRDPLGE